MKSKNLYNIKRIIAILMLIIFTAPYYVSFAEVNDKAHFRTVRYQGGDERTGIVKTNNLYDKNAYLSYRLKNDNLKATIRTRQIQNLKNNNVAVYCLDLNEEFPPKSGEEYISRGEWMKYDVSGIGLKRIEENPVAKAKLNWIFNNIYTSKENMPGRLYNKQELANNVFDGNTKVFEVLTDDDIEFVNQWAIWYFTNNKDFENGFGLNTLALEKYENVLNQNPVQFALRKAYMMKLFNYYIQNAKPESDENVKPEVKAPKEAVLNSNGLNLKYFEIKFAKNNKTNIKSIELKDENGNVIPRENYILLDKLGNVLKGDLIDNLNKEINVRIIKNAEKINIVNLSLNYAEKSTKAEVFRLNTNNMEELKKYQPVIQINKKTITKNINAKVKITKDEEEIVDLALRKAIVKIADKEIKDRAPKGKKINTENLLNSINLKGKDTTAQYLHAKNPLEVKEGDIVKYQISIYNEGNIDYKAKEVKDRLPKGLEFVETTLNSKYKWTVDKEGNISTKLPNEVIIPKMKNANGKKSIYSLDLFVELKVSKNLKDGDILTNIAYISKMDEKDRDSKANEIKISEEDLKNYTGKNNKSDLSDSNYFYKGIEDDDDFEKLVVRKKEPEKPKEKDFDLALKKFITKISRKEDNKNKEMKFERVPSVDVNPLLEGKTDAKYTKIKDEIKAKKGDIVTYKLRVYNEGNIDGFASVVADNLPEGLKFVDTKLNNKYGWKVRNINGTKEIYTDYLKDKLIKAFDKNKKQISFVDLELELEVEKENGEILNIAEIIENKDKDGKDIKDRDSVPGNKKPGEDDLDTEKVTVKDEKTEEKIGDLALRKFVKSINDVNVNREPKINVQPLIEGKNTAIYEHDKTPLKVKAKDLVKYKISVYNEGDVDAYASEIVDNIPEGLEFVIENNINKKYNWVMLDKDGRITNDKSKAVKVATNYLSKEEDKDGKNNLIKAFNKNNKYVDFKEVEIVFKVKDIEEKVNTKNIAEISKQEDKDGKNLKDRDSVPGNFKEGEDDIDSEEVEVEVSKFDLKLVKFASNLNGEILKQEPKVDITNLISGKSTTANYLKSGDILNVAKGDVVKYTIRVFNEGNRNGYAAEIVDNIPEGLEFLRMHTINKYYEWEMLDKNGNITEDVFKAKKIRTKYLAKSENMLNALDKENKAIDYKDVEVVFRVAANKGENNNLLNIAEITKNLDENKKDIKDIDSVPGNGIKGEDDMDEENLKLVVFDLALTKRISQITKTFENKKPYVYKTKQTGEEKHKKTEIVQVNTWDKTKDVYVKYVIKVKNQGNIPGYAKEIKDYIPKGLIFDQKMNKDWRKNKDGSIVSKKLANVEIKPGQSKEIELVLRWNYNWEDSAVKTNWAEINKDSNKFRDIDDVDSTPGNFKKNEDDIDHVSVRIIPATGAANTYYMLIGIVLSVVLVGTISIKKFVLDKKVLA